MTGRELEILLKSGIRRKGEINRQCLIFRNPKRGLREEAKKAGAGTQIIKTKLIFPRIFL